jgi:hypothetical protein
MVNLQRQVKDRWNFPVIVKKRGEMTDLEFCQTALNLLHCLKHSVNIADSRSEFRYIVRMTQRDCGNILLDNLLTDPTMGYCHENISVGSKA